MIENWKDVVGYEGLYMVSDMGSVKSLDRPKQIRKKSYKSFLKGKQLKISLAGSGTGKYPFVSLWKDGKPKQHYIHRLILTAFVGEPAPAMTANHKNGIHADNRLVNLEWITQAENNLHAYRVLRRSIVACHGERSANAKLTWKKVDHIRSLRTQDPVKWQLKTLGKKFGVSFGTIHNVVTGKTWKQR